MHEIKTCFTTSEYTYLIYDKNLNISEWTFIIKELKLSNFSQLSLMLQYSIIAGIIKERKQTKACTLSLFNILFHAYDG